MPHPVVEIVSFHSVKSYRDDPAKALAGFVDVIKKLDGHVATYHAPEVEDDTKAYLIIEWKSYEHHKAIMESPSYSNIVASLRPALSTFVDPAIKAVHVDFDKDPSAAFGAPATEMASFALNDPSKKAIAVENLKLLADTYMKGSIMKAWGPTVEDENLFMVAVGWVNIAAHYEAKLTMPEEAKKAVAVLYDICTVKFNHAHFVKYA